MNTVLAIAVAITAPVAATAIWELALVYAFERRWINGYSIGTIPRSWQDHVEGIGSRHSRNSTIPRATARPLRKGNR